MNQYIEKLGMMVMLLALGIVPATAAREEAAPDQTAAREMRVARYDERARGIHAPMYAYYARKIKEVTGITRGVCLDVGSGGGYLGLDLAGITDLDFIFLDISPEMLKMADRHIREDKLESRARTILADVHRIPLADESIDLVISRGSLPFWKDPATALKEIYRVLAPGGHAYVGGGRGTPEIRRQIEAKRKALGLAPFEPKKKKGGPWSRMTRHNYDEILKQAGITAFSIQRGDDGMWIRMWK